MKNLYVLTLVLTIAPVPQAVIGAPVLPALHGKHPLTQEQAGRLLMNELRCAACHADAGVGLPQRLAPDLVDVGSRVSPAFLQDFIASPSAARAGTTMPDVLAAETPARRKEIAEAITHFLVSGSSDRFNADPGDAKAADAGKELFHAVGCVACHSPRDGKDRELLKDGVTTLVHLPAKYSLASLEAFLFQPTRARPSGRMPDIKLTRQEAGAIASYLIGPDAKAARALDPKPELVAKGKAYFAQYNCAACHKLGDAASAPAGAMATLNPTRGCLSGDVGKHPGFNLSDEQTRAIRAALASKPEPMADQARINMTLTAFNCLACHVRDDFGGVPAGRDEYFQTTEKNLGEEARIPPPLTNVGAKLQTLWMQKVLFDGESVRPYMLTRMPQFGEANLGHLPDLFERVDTMEKFEFKEPNREREKVLRAAGQELLGDKGLNCVTCHTFNGRPSQGFKGIDLMTSYQRLKPAWYRQFMLDPGKVRPRTIMPTYWPGGKAVRPEILDGDTDAQLEAMWYYFSLGTSARNPSGLVGSDSKLYVTDMTRTYRGRSGIAGYRGIAVGFPSGLSYAFNAETGTLTGLWSGEFINVQRGGQGSGGFNPATRAVSLAQDVSFFALPDEKTPWPLRPRTTKGEPVDPDPLYPRNRGYQFKGYYFDSNDIPTFMYRTEDISIEDRSVPARSDEKTTLVRTLAFSSPKAQTIWFRALTGKFDEASKQQFKTRELSLSIPALQTLNRKVAGEGEGNELLLKLEIPKGDSKVTLTYELLQK